MNPMGIGPGNNSARTPARQRDEANARAIRRARERRPLVGIIVKIGSLVVRRNVTKSDANVTTTVVCIRDIAAEQQGQSY